MSDCDLHRFWPIPGIVFSLSDGVFWGHSTFNCNEVSSITNLVYHLCLWYLRYFRGFISLLEFQNQRSLKTSLFAFAISLFLKGVCVYEIHFHGGGGGGSHKCVGARVVCVCRGHVDLGNNFPLIH